jgi:hypothetical protein
LFLGGQPLDGLHPAPPRLSTATGDRRCLAPSCFKQRVSRNCVQQMCKSHCIEEGGCTATGHRQAPALEQRGATTREQGPLALLADEAAYRQEHLSIQSLLPPTPLVETESASRLPPPTALETPGNFPDHASVLDPSLVLPLGLETSGNFPDLASVLDPSLALPPGSISTSTSQASSVSLSQSLEVPSSQKTSSRPKMTRQMSDTWMEDYQDRTTDAKIGVSKGGNRAQVDHAVVRRFILVYWDAVTVHCSWLEIKLTLFIRMTCQRSYEWFKTAQNGQCGRCRIL